MKLSVSPLYWRVNNRPFAQLLPGLETGHPVTVGQSPVYEFSVSDEQKAVFLVSVSDCSVCDSCAGDWPTVTGCPVSNPGNNCANGLLPKWYRFSKLAFRRTQNFGARLGCSQLQATFVSYKFLSNPVAVAFEVPPFGVVSASGASQVQLGVWGGAVSPPAGSGAAPQKLFENYAYNEASFAHFDNNCLS